MFLIWERPRPVFQFLKGSIKSNTNDLRDDAIAHFNSSKVRLKGHMGAVEGTKDDYFNSSKVRLKVCMVGRSYPLLFYFNSSKVQLKGVRYSGARGER